MGHGAGSMGQGAWGREQGAGSMEQRLSNIIRKSKFLALFSLHVNAADFNVFS